ncbi:MAG: hypothetical protein U1E65_06330 [Myxococcota bacterium]
MGISVRRTLTALALASSLTVPWLSRAEPAAPVKEEKVEKTGISWEVEPAQVVIFLDDKKVGDAGSTKFTEAKPGKHVVKLVLGKDETEMEVNVKKGQALKFTFAFGG